MSWRLARSLTTLRAEIDTAAPNRDKASDGTIGDAAHASRVSQHNPNPAGVVTAIDITHDPAGGMDCSQLAAFLTAKAHRHRVWYVVWDHRICSRTSGWSWKPYTGPDPHTSHLHLSVLQDPAHYDDPRSWGWNGNEDDDMPTPQEVAAAVWDEPIKPDPTKPTQIQARTMVRRTYQTVMTIAQAVSEDGAAGLDRDDVKQAMTELLREGTDAQ